MSVPWGLQRSFDIDDGQLDDLSPQECFVLGYELAQIDAALARPAAFSMMIHATNRDRASYAIREAGREFSLKWLAGDASEEWLELRVNRRGD